MEAKRIENALSDRLNPVIVKELRQELRSKSFNFIFLAAQGFMVAAVLLQGISESNALARGQGNFLSTFIFWASIVVPLLIIIPRQGFSSFARDFEAKALELVMLTSLTAWRFIFGKWAALAFQAGLFVVSILPYTLFRYFVGDQNPFMTLQAIGLLFVGSLFLSAFAVSGSAGRRRAPPVIVMLILALLLGYPLLGLISLLGRWSSTTLFIPFGAAAALAIFGPLGILQIIESGVSRVAPVTENFAPRKRLLCIIVPLLGWIFVSIAQSDAARGMAGAIVPLATIPLCISSILEPLHPLLLSPRKSSGRRLDWLRFPGWAGGLATSFVVALLLLMMLLTISKTSTITGMDFVKLQITVFGCGAVPFTMMKYLFPERRHTMISFVIVTAISAFLAAIAASPGIRGTLLAYVLNGFFPFGEVMRLLSGPVSYPRYVSSGPVVITFLAIYLLARKYRISTSDGPRYLKSLTGN